MKKVSITEKSCFSDNRQSSGTTPAMTLSMPLGDQYWTSTEIKAEMVYAAFQTFGINNGGDYIAGM